MMQPTSLIRGSDAVDTPCTDIEMAGPGGGGAGALCASAIDAHASEDSRRYDLMLISMYSD
jgi:hypothetical protein